jgi:hypothetical protein
MTLPPQGHPQYELRRRIADCRERLRRARTGQKMNEHNVRRANDEPTNERAHAHRRSAPRHRRD